jgi:hypothetical protein
VCIFLLSALPAIAQDTILIQDAHFELRNPYNPESVWQSAGLRPPFMLVAGAGETDVQPHDGNQCITLSLSGNEWAGINQLLADTFQKDSLYRFSLWLSHSNTFQSKASDSNKMIPFKAPVCLAVAGHRRAEGIMEILAVTPPVSSTVWRKYVIYFKPLQQGLNELTFFAFPENGISSPPGNVLVDRVSKIVKIPAPYPDSLTEISGLALKTERIDASGIPLANPSFEYVWFGGRPQYWETLIFEGPDAARHINKEEIMQWYNKDKRCLPFEVEPSFIKKAAKGKKFTALFTTKCDLRLGLATLLPYVQLQKDSAYSFSLSLSKEKRWKSLYGSGNKYKNPLRLRIWAGTQEAPRTELLAVSSPVTHSDWRTYSFELYPTKGDYDILLLEVGFLSPYGRPYDGHLLLDNCSRLQTVRIR